MNRKDVSIINNNFYDSQRVGETELKLEQNGNVSRDASIISNHYGSGILLKSLEKKVLFDSSDLNAEQAALLAANIFDGYGIATHAQPSDSSLGNQLEITLSGSSVWGRFTTKVAVVGLDFEGNLQLDRFYFHKNGTYVTSKHYSKILSLFFNDFKGNSNCSRNFGGKIIIKEAESFQLSSDCLMVAQDLEPDLFWRDFKINSYFSTLSQVIQTGIGSEYSVDALEINTTGLDSKTLIADDVVSQVGQKFLAKTNNIQKITLLLGITKNSEVAEADWYDWSGDFIVSIYPLQTTTSCPTDVIPSLAIDFDPTAQPLVQISYNQTSLKDIGYVLTDVLQPVDFVFNNTKIAVPDGITADKYYIATVKRSGDASNGEFLIGCGRDRVDNSRVSLFNGSWVDIAEEDLWFQVWTDAIKIADGMGYDSGNGMQFDKTKINSETGLPIDNEVKYKSFAYTGETTLNIGILAAIENYTKTKQNEKSGANINSLKQFIPQFSFVNAAGLTNLQTSLDPVIIGTAKDSNPKSNTLLEKIQLYPGLAVGDTFCIINPDADLLSLNLVGSKLIPNIKVSNKEYRIFKSTFCTDGYGDLNGDGIIDEEDLVRIAELVGEGISLASTQQKIVDGYFDTLELLKADLDGDGYVTSTDVDLLNSYVTKETNSFPVGSSFTHICFQVQSSIGRYDGYFDCDGLVRLDGYSGQNLVNPDTLTQAELEYDGYFIDQQIQSDPVFLQVPFVPVIYQIVAQPFWQDYFILTTSEARIVPAIFSDTVGVSITECNTTASNCEEKDFSNDPVDVGKNDAFFPDDLYLMRGQIKRPNGDLYKPDIEIGTIILQLPQVPLAEAALNVFEKLVADSGNGLTSAGYKAMKYSDCTTVQREDLVLNKVKFDVAIQSFYPNLDGYSETDGYGVIVDDIIGVYIDPLNGILTLSIKDLSVDPVYMTLVSKLQITVFLKKSGWNNEVLTIESNQLEGLLS